MLLIARQGHQQEAFSLGLSERCAPFDDIGDALLGDPCTGQVFHSVGLVGVQVVAHADVGALTFGWVLIAVHGQALAHGDE